MIKMNNPEYIEVKGKKYKINTDFRVALECNKIAEDKNINDIERAMAIIYKLFGEEALNDVENYNDFLQLAIQYLLCGEDKKSENKKPDMNFEQDYNLIWASFMSDYNGMDIDTEQIHWWKFYNLLSGLSNSELGNCCILNNIRNLRNRDPREIKDDKQRQLVIEAQKKWALKKYQAENNLTSEQEKSMNEFNKLIGI